jgi:hypoxanthine phosphoribosyltransferase
MPGSATGPTGFEAPDVFVVGYGIDYAEQFRHLPYIGKVD